MRGSQARFLGVERRGGQGTRRVSGSQARFLGVGRRGGQGTRRVSGSQARFLGVGLGGRAPPLKTGTGPRGGRRHSRRSCIRFLLATKEADNSAAWPNGLSRTAPRGSRVSLRLGASFENLAAGRPTQRVHAKTQRRQAGGRNVEGFTRAPSPQPPCSELAILAPAAPRPPTLTGGKAVGRLQPLGTCSLRPPQGAGAACAFVSTRIARLSPHCRPTIIESCAIAGETEMYFCPVGVW